MEVAVIKAIARAETTLDSAKINFEHNHLLSSVSCSYFAYFWLVKALLFRKNVFDETYKGIRRQFRELYVDTEIVPHKFVICWSEITNNREEADYELSPDFTNEDVQDMINYTEEFLGFVKGIIEKSGGYFDISLNRNSN
jgi:uncharacterized protein (UPF0332 family)